jgi:hypothetical protein
MRKYTIEGLGLWSFGRAIDGFVCYLHHSLDLTTSSWIPVQEAKEKEDALIKLGVACEEVKNEL